MHQANDVALSAYTTLGLGGPAALMVTAYDEEEIVAALRAATGPVLVLGGGSNLVVADEGFPGTVVRIASQGRTASHDGDDVQLEVAAGEDWDALVATCVEEGLAGVECLAGVPGLVGATPVQNVGAYGQDVSETVVSVRVYDRSRDEVRTLTDCGFAYRSSRFKVEAPRWVVLSVTYRLTRSPQSRPVRYAELAGVLGVELGGTAPLPDVRDAVLSLRRRKGMVLDPNDPDTRSAGSFFTNPLLDAEQLDALRASGVEPPAYPEADGRMKVPAAWLIERVGFSRGDFDGPVGISSKHALALVNRGGARTEDLIRVARVLRDRVRETFGVELVPEPVLVGVSLDPREAPG
jgi:UDP-N-acetylmuramate dehydrogenase